MKKISFLGIILIVVGIGFSFLSIVVFKEIQASIEYFKTLPPGSNQPILDYSNLYSFIVSGIILITAGCIVYLRSGL